jgi:EpsI family protein
MQNPKILALTALAILAAGILANRFVGRLQLAEPRLLPIETFPKHVGDWRMTEDRPPRPEIMGSLPTAHMVDRIYVNSAGRAINLVLVSATDYNAFHDPKTCIPAQGWELITCGTVRLGGHSVNTVTAGMGAERMRFFYWLAGSGADIPLGDYGTGKPLRKLYAIKRLLTGTEEASMFVRLAVDGDAQSDPVLADFTEAAEPCLTNLTSERKLTVVSSELR